ncbi:hypothetical protein T492DRAFT_1086382 [Pavlovales sp. CCMP2436]|nr:hypothetical protein T492DRAFT_1086382 [Pavlovales sp. CCMP2436]
MCVTWRCLRRSSESRSLLPPSLVNPTAVAEWTPVVSVLFPLAASLAALRSGELEAEVHWVQYWSIYAVLALLRGVAAAMPVLSRATDASVSLVPQLPFVELVFFLWLHLPRAHATDLLFSRIRPRLREPETPSAVSRVSDAIWRSADKIRRRTSGVPKLRDGDGIATPRAGALRKAPRLYMMLIDFLGSSSDSAAAAAVAAMPSPSRAGSRYSPGSPALLKFGASTPSNPPGVGGRETDSPVGATPALSRHSEPLGSAPYSRRRVPDSLPDSLPDCPETSDISKNQSDVDGSGRHAHDD